MDPTLSFDENITSVSPSCLSSLSQINRVKHLLERNTLLTVINALVLANSIIVHLSGLLRQRRISTNYRMSKTSQLGLEPVRRNLITLPLFLQNSNGCLSNPCLSTGIAYWFKGIGLRLSRQEVHKEV